MRNSRDRMIIDYSGRMRLCCEDIAEEWGLGSIYDFSLYELWNSERHLEILDNLSRPGGRLKYDYCSICPRPDEPCT
jgi:radical SAM protein with 4Fe4S-binding SPASM domain